MPTPSLTCRHFHVSIVAIGCCDTCHDGDLNDYSLPTKATATLDGRTYSLDVCCSVLTRLNVMSAERRQTAIDDAVASLRKVPSPFQPAAESEPAL